jgi:zona occludens toxin
MSVKAYTGRMGSGKSYEVVTVVILDALAAGVRVVSNIAGLNFQEMLRVLDERGVARDKVGQLVAVDHDEVLEPSFWLTDDMSEGVDAFLQPGDLLVLDEVWRFWSGFNDKTMPPQVMNFFRMHRHFVHPETGMTCNVALIAQDIYDIGRKVRSVVEETYYMEKLTVVGATKRYRVDVFSGAKTSRAAPLRSLQRAYDKKLFNLYSSHSQKQSDAEAVERNIDGRGNLLSGLFFKLGVPAAVVFVGLGVFFVYDFLTPDKEPAKGRAVVSKVGKPKTSAPASAPPASGAPVSRPDRDPFMPVDRLSELLRTGSPRLMYVLGDDAQLHFRVEFDSNGRKVFYDEEQFFAHGWRIFSNPERSAVYVTNGHESHIVTVQFLSLRPASAMR